MGNTSYYKSLLAEICGKDYSMKRLLRYLTGTVCVLAISAACYYISFQSMLNKYNSDYNDNITNNQSLEEYLYVKEGDTAEADNDNLQNTESVTADTEPDLFIKPGTVFYLEINDLKEQKLTKEIQVLPPEFLGLSREGLLEYLDNYMKNIPFKEYQNGLTSYELLSFSGDTITLRKTYNSNFKGNLFFVTLHNDLIVVYYSDLKNVYEYTDISVSALSADEKDALVTGIYVKDVEELYDILASYTS